jgi:uncharacterized protein DUF3618
MAETTADVRREIEVTRERMSTTLSQLERKVNVMQWVRDHPWPALGMAVGAGLVIGRTGSESKAATATLAATRGASTHVSGMLDDIFSRMTGAVNEVVQGQVDRLIDDVKGTLTEALQGGRSPAR